MDTKTIITEAKNWLKNAYTSIATGTEQRKWCVLGMTDNPTLDSMDAYFDRKDLNEQFNSQYNNQDIPSKEAYAYTQVEINNIAAAHRSLAVRYKTRMQIYRDDCQQKQYHIRSALTLGLAKHQVAKEKAEEKR